MKESTGDFKNIKRLRDHERQLQRMITGSFSWWKSQNRKCPLTLWTLSCPFVSTRPSLMKFPKGLPFVLTFNFQLKSFQNILFTLNCSSWLFHRRFRANWHPCKLHVVNLCRFVLVKTTMPDPNFYSSKINIKQTIMQRIMHAFMMQRSKMQLWRKQFINVSWSLCRYSQY